ncbi:ewing's tumor-associated antigen 1 isoform X2 [Paroedura picta]
MWIGDNAIPCTPEIAKARSRTKLNSTRGLRLKNKEEELMKLAKQFDKNLTEAIQQQDAPHPNAAQLLSEAKLSVTYQGDAQVEDPQHLPGEPPQADVTSLLGAVKENTETCEGSGQRPVDFDAEVVLNALFDCTPTKCSGKLSQGSSNGGSHNSQNALLVEEHIPEEAAGGAHGSVATGKPQTHGSAASNHRGVPTAEKARTVFQQTIQSAVISKTEPQRAAVSKTEPAVSGNVVGDDFEDWDADLLSDDSFVMQITQNPELIRTPQSASPSAVQESCKAKERRINSGRPHSGHCSFPKSLNDVMTSLAIPKPGCELGSTRPLPSQSRSPLKNCSRRSQNRIPGYNSITGKLENKSVTEGFTQLKSANLPGKKTASISVHPNLKPLTGKSSIYCEPSSLFPNSKPSDQQELASHASSHHLLAGLPKKQASTFGDWDEPRISDKVLDLFRKSESLWDAGCEDDDLLYQVCDDVERNTLSQDVAKENVKAALVVVGTARLETDPGFRVAKQGLANCLQPQKNRKTFSLNAPLTTAMPPKGENSSEPCRQLSSLPFKAESTNSSQGKLYRSNFVLDGSLASKSGSVLMSDACLNTNSVQCQNVTWNDRKVQDVCRRHQASHEKSKYAFRKASSSQARVSDCSSVTGESFGGAPLALGESKNGPNIPLGTALQTNPKTAFRRHFSDSVADMGTEQQSRKCSQEEIARKKQEALERRKYKMLALLKNTAPT